MDDDAATMVRVPMPRRRRNGKPRMEGRDVCAVVLTIGVATAVNLLMLAVLYDALRSDTPGLSENATQIITGALGGMLGVLGAYLGFRAGETSTRADDPSRDATPPAVLARPPGPDFG